MIKLVTMANPCSACLMIDGLMRGLLRKTADGMDNVELVIEELRHPKECADIDGLEVEKLPAVLIDGEQVTAGGLLHRRQLIKMIESHIW